MKGNMRMGQVDWLKLKGLWARKEAVINGRDIRIMYRWFSDTQYLSVYISIDGDSFTKMGKNTQLSPVINH